MLQLFHKARASGRIDAREAQAFQAAERRLSLHAHVLAKGSLTLPECQQLGKEIAAERATVLKMAAGPATKAPPK